MTSNEKRRMPLAKRIFIGLVGGAALGVTAHALFRGQAWLDWLVTRVTGSTGGSVGSPPGSSLATPFIPMADFAIPSSSIR